MKRNVRGTSFIESVVGTALLALAVTASTTIYIMFNRELVSTSADRDSSEKGHQIKYNLAPALEGMLFRKYLPGTIEQNGPINFEFSRDSTVSARWYWSNDEVAMLQLYPHIYGVTQNSGVCLQDRITTVIFDRENKSLSIDYKHMEEGKLVGCLGGDFADLIRTGKITYKNVSEAQLVRVGNRANRFWYKVGDEWLSIEGGFLEQ
ncbi:hypothetical protein [Gloeobacter violaceus]|uniref:hypothetical protein n=1 Tax=Gloeobacter violaceus TaxID=33072 RepID=UPI0013E8D5B9|nr:hypothetical protein [Gloeobacter violaceus]